MKKIFISLFIIIAIAIAYWLISPLWIVKYVDDVVPLHQQETSTTTINNATTTESLSGIFVNGAHNVSGAARVIDSDEGKVLRFENFKTLNGPDLRIYLATDNSAKDFIEIGPVKGTEGNINYPIPQGTDLRKYKHVLVWCKTFVVLFGSAELK